MAEQRSVLFSTNSEFGQANVVLSVIYELLTNHPDIYIHVASWPRIEPRLKQIHAQVQAQNPNTNVPPIKFHLLPYLSQVESCVAHMGEQRVDLPHAPGTKDTARLMELIPEMLAPWDPEEHLDLYRRLLKLGEEIDPTVIVVDPFFSPAHDMARTSKWKNKHCILCPCSVGLALAMEQPYLQGWWRYPGPATGLPYPLPLDKIMASIYSSVTGIYCFLTSPRLKEINAARKREGIQGWLASFTPYVPDVLHITPSLAHLDYPLKYPDNVLNCGPIVLPSESVEKVDPELFAWLANGKTVLICLGSHHEYSVSKARETASGVRIFLERNKDIQVLWKLLPSKNPGEAEKVVEIVNNILALEIKSQKVRVVSWLKVDPFAILLSGHVVANVHHGGANSFFESCYAGVPQVVLAQWYDTYDNAARAEYLEVGVYGNKNVAPGIEKEELANALMKVVGTGIDGFGGMAEKAAQCGKLCRASEGRAKAAEAIAKFVENEAGKTVVI